MPGSGNSVVINSASNNPLYDGSSALSAFTINSGTLDLNGYNLNINGTVNLNGGTLANGTFTVNGADNQTCTMGGVSTSSSCNLKITSGLVLISGGTYNGTVEITQTGTTTSSGSGGATFNNTITIEVNNGGTLRTNGGNSFNASVTYVSNGASDIIPEYTTSSTYNGVLYINNSGTGKISIAYSGNNNQLNENLYIRNAAGGTVMFGENNGTCGLANTKTIESFGSGLTSGILKLYNFIQLGTTSQSLSGSGDAIISLEKGTEFYGNVTFNFPQIYLNGATYHKPASFTYTAFAGTQSDGGNVFNDDVEIIKSGSGNIILSNENRDIYNGIATFTNTTSGILYVAHNDNVYATQFNGNVNINNTGSGSIRFGQGTGSVSLASGKTINVGSLGVSSGTVQIKNFTQSGSTAQSLTFTGTAIMRIQNNCVFNGNISFTSPQIFINATTFNGTAYIEKTGSSANASAGGNTFNQDVTVKNSGSGSMTFASTSADNFNGNATFIKSGTGALNPAANAACTFSKNISTAGSNASITFGNDAGSVILNGTGTQYIQGDVSYPPTIKRFTANCGTGGSITLQVPVNISDQLTLTNGIIYTSAANCITITSISATVSIGNNSSYVNGPFKFTMSYNGTSTLHMPIGKNGNYRPAKVTPTHSNSNPYTYTAEMFNSDANMLTCSPKPAGIANISAVRYWRINRSAESEGLSSATVELYYDTNDGVFDFANLKVIKSSGSDCPSVWINVGGTANANNTGSIVSGSFASFSVFTLGNIEGGGNPLPIQLSNFSASCENDRHHLQWTTLSELNNKHFEIEQSVDAKVWNKIGLIVGAGTAITPNRYSFTTSANQDYYYRLKQVDFDARFEYSPVVFIKSCDVRKISIQINPNPVHESINIQYTGINQNDVVFAIIRDLIGQQVVATYSNSTKTINTQTLPPGMYMLQLVLNDGRNYYQNFVKQ